MNEPERTFADRDGDLWLEEPDDMLSPLSGPVAWAFSGFPVRHAFVEAEFGPLTEVTP